VTACEVTAPAPERPTEGFFTFNVDFSPMSSPEFDLGRCVHHLMTPSVCPLIAIREGNLLMVWSWDALLSVV